MERCQRNGKGPVGITLHETERVRDVVVVECNLAGGGLGFSSHCFSLYRLLCNNALYSQNVLAL